MPPSLNSVRVLAADPGFPASLRPDTTAIVRGLNGVWHDNPVVHKGQEMIVTPTTNPTIHCDTFRVVATREITTQECPWLERNIPAGTMMFVSSDPYGCCTPQGLPIEFAGSSRMLEVPLDAVVGIIENEEA
jgi:hypothetical protein